ncbi:MAG: pitrilysin family protein [Woeseiaceae bacterium]|nr:pitrilysin family protein [Woeseiaceae bacterium]
MAVFAEMRRRNVFKVALLYAVLSWLVVWFVGAIQSEVAVPVWTETFVYFVLIVGFPVALWFAWTYEITPVGLKKAIDVDQTQSIVYKTGQKLNAAVAVLLVLGVLAVFGQRLLPTFEFLVPGLPAGDAPVRATTPPEIRRLTLDNGLTVIAWPDHDIPNVAMYTFVRAGGRNEYPGITGLSHFFEHMMFLGTENLEPGEFDRQMEAAGGANNAYTTNDVTVYTNWFPRSALDTIFELEADRFQNLQTYSDAVQSEREVVYSERRMRVDNNNDLKLMEQVFATAFIAHPYQFPVIGWPSDIEQWTEQDLEDFYRTYYAPNNLTLVVVGDVTTQEVFRLADRHFGSIPAQAPPPQVRTIEPEQMGARRVIVETAAQAPLLHMAFHATDATDPRALHLTLLMNILTGGESSRLHRTLIEEEQLVLSVDGWWGAWLDPGLVYFFLTLPPGGDLASVERRMLDELQRIADDGVTDAELQKARNIVAADIYRQLATIRGKADAIGDYEVFHGDYEALFHVAARIDNVSAEQLRATAAAVFDEDNMTVGILLEPPEEAQ